MPRVANVPGETVGGPLAASIRTRLPWLTIKPGDDVPCRGDDRALRVHTGPGRGARRLPPGRRGARRDRRTQTFTLIVRAIALGELVGVSARRLLMREAVLGLLHGAWLGILVAVIAILWTRNVGLGLVLGIAMLGNMVIAGSIGAAVPLVLRRIGVDPAVASAVVVTTVTDVCGFLLFLGVATAAIDLIT